MSNATLKKMQAVQDKKSASTRMTNVVCSSAINPDEFEVDPSPRPLSRKATANTAMLATFDSAVALGGARGGGSMSPMSPTMGVSATTTATTYGNGGGGGRRDREFLENSTHSEDYNGILDPAAPVPSLSHIEHHFLAQQVQWNLELFKLKLYNLLDVAVLPEEEETILEKLQELREQMIVPPYITAPGAAAVDGSSSNNGGSRPVSATRRGLGPTPLSGSQSSSSPTATPSATAKLALQVGFAIDGAFRFALEEVSLRWMTLQDRPFSLRAYHQVAREQVKLRQAAREEQGKAEKQVEAMKQHTKTLQYKLDHDEEQHASTIQVLLTENRVLRQRIMDLQQKYKTDEPIPQLHDNKAGGNKEGVNGAPIKDGEDGAPLIDPNEKHYETLNRRLTEECMLLSHTLEQRNQTVKALHSELTTTKTQMTTIKDEFRKHVHDQEVSDVEFRALFAQNELATENAKRECATAVRKAAEAEAELARLSASVDKLNSQITKLDSERSDACAERDHLRTVNTALVVETEAAKDALLDAQTRAAEAAAIAAELLAVANARIFELENDGTKEKLESALAENATLHDKVKSQQRAIESRDRQIQTMRAEHKEEVNRLEEQIAKGKEELVNATAKFEELLKRERQKGVELAEKRVSEAKVEFEKERETFRGQLHDADRILRDLTHEVMLFHRQSTIMEGFLREHLDKETLRALGKLILRRDIRNTRLQRGGESEVEPYDDGNDVNGTQKRFTDGVHTPRTRLYFGQHRPLDPEEVQHRLTCASEQIDPPPQQSARGDGDGLPHPVLPRFPQQDSAGVALLLKSRITQEFLQDLYERQTINGVPTVIDAFVAQESMVALPPLHEIPARVDDDDHPVSSNNDKDESVRIPLRGETRLIRRSILEHQQDMVVEEFKSKLVEANLKVKALQDELRTWVEGEHGDDVYSAGIQTSFPSVQSLNGSPRKIRSAGRSRPSSGNKSHRGSETLFDSPGMAGALPASSIASVPGSTAIHKVNGHLGRPGSAASRSGAFGILDDDSASSVGIIAPASPLHPHGGNVNDAVAGGDGRPTSLGFYADESAPFLLAREFPGLQHATEFIDLFETFHQLRQQLSRLVNVCVQDTEHNALRPDDLTEAQELLHSKFSIFRAVEAQNNSMLHRLHHKKEDVMRHREEELERVLAAMQNIAVTHPKESASLLRVAKSASRAHQRRTGEAASKLRPAVADGSFLRNQTELSAVVIRPLSQQSMRRLTPIPTDVLVSGAPVLMNLRSRAASATPSRGNKK